MKKRNLKSLYLGVSFLVAFIVWTTLIAFIDVKPIGPNNSTVGFSLLNNFIHSFTGVHLILYNITDLLSFVPFVFIFIFAIIGLTQWIKRKKLSKVDFNILLLGAFYVVVLAIYVLFDFFVLNYRPILINGVLEVSYPSSTTMLVLCIMPTTALRLKRIIKNIYMRNFTNISFVVFSTFMVLARLVSGVHWFTDIIGGVLLSIGLVNVYIYLSYCNNK